MTAHQEPEDSRQDEDLDKILGSIDRLHQTIDEFNTHVSDLKNYLEGYLVEDVTLTEFSSLEEYYRYQEMSPISEEEVESLNIDELIQNLTSPRN